MARAVHNLSARLDRVLVRMNCAAIPSGLPEGEPFGHEKRAFTGGPMRKKGSMTNLAQPRIPVLGCLFDSFDAFNFFDPRYFAPWHFTPENSPTYSSMGLVCGLPYCEWEEAMLKISLIDSARQRRLVVEGKLIAPWAAELSSACAEARADLRGRELVIEMKDITAISHEGENVILELANEGIQFRCHGVFTKHVVKRLTRRASRNVRTRAGD